MRDPVERIVSAVRMNRRNSLKANRSVGPSEDLDVLLAYKNPDVELRTRYEKTIRNLREVYTEDELIFELFENLFTQETIERITQKLGIFYQEPHFEMFYNQSKTDEIISDDVRRTVAQYYAETYRYIETEFPHFQTRELWKSSALLAELTQ
jgi:hypothetical protein